MKVPQFRLSKKNLAINFLQPASASSAITYVGTA
jgi:hypothetical protein